MLFLTLLQLLISESETSLCSRTVYRAVIADLLRDLIRNDKFDGMFLCLFRNSLVFVEQPLTSGFIMCADTPDPRRLSLASQPPSLLHVIAGCDRAQAALVGVQHAVWHVSQQSHGRKWRQDVHAIRHGDHLERRDCHVVFRSNLKPDSAIGLGSAKWSITPNPKRCRMGYRIQRAVEDTPDSSSDFRDVCFRAACIAEPSPHTLWNESRRPHHFHLLLGQTNTTVQEKTRGVWMHRGCGQPERAWTASSSSLLFLCSLMGCMEMEGEVLDNPIRIQLFLTFFKNNVRDLTQMFPSLDGFQPSLK